MEVQLLRELKLPLGDMTVGIYWIWVTCLRSILPIGLRLAHNALGAPDMWSIKDASVSKYVD